MLAIVLAAALAALPQVPDPAKTPGVVDPAKTLAVICVPGFTSQPGVRHVTAATKRRAFAAYGINPKGPGAPFEVDHLISLEDGGSNDIRNLWPQSYITQPWNARRKDHLENLIHAKICKGEISLAQGQLMLSSGWIAAYLKLIGPPSAP